MNNTERFFRVRKRYFADGDTIHVVITNAIRRSANTMTESEIDGIKQVWRNEGYRIISRSDYEV